MNNLQLAAADMSEQMNKFSLFSLEEKQPQQDITNRGMFADAAED